MSARRAQRAAIVAVVVGSVTWACSGPGPSPAQTQAAEPAVFDSSIVHSLEVDFDPVDYVLMIGECMETGDKGWIEATVTIDGETHEQVGMRLKGNSTLWSVCGGGFRPIPPGAATAAEPERLPWLIRFDKFVDDQLHQDHEDLVIRSNGSRTALNEAVAVELLRQAGLASQPAASTRFTVNGRDAALRLTIESPNDNFFHHEYFDGDGAMYKAESGGSWSYRGDAPDLYASSFEQKGGKKHADMTPLIDLLRFLAESDDATFAAELPRRLDVEGLAAYLAMMELLHNKDDIDGAGNNSYLWYDVASEQFTVVPWDMNLALGVGLNGICSGECSALPARPNPLTQRFHANAEFESLYQRTLAVLRVYLFDSGTAEEVLDSLAAVLTEQAADLVEPATIAAEADAIRQRLTASCVTATNDEHVEAGRATAFFTWAYARGSNTYLGLLGAGETTSLQGNGSLWTPVESC